MIAASSWPAASSRRIACASRTAWAASKSARAIARRTPSPAAIETTIATTTITAMRARDRGAGLVVMRAGYAREVAGSL
jgi:hypothetical protein